MNARSKWAVTAAAIAMILYGNVGLAEETPAQRDARMKWWREAKFGMFIHWGVYSVPAGTYKGKRIRGIGEWIMRRAHIPVAEYRAFARQFNPVNYNPDAWAALAERAGMKYMVITSKHHDGFALFDSKVTDWDVVDATPYGRDLIAPLAKAARKHGLKFGLYYSQAQDWTHPGGAKSGYKDHEGWDAAHKGSFDAYLKKIAVPQVREILTHYEPDILWWDTPRLMTPERAKPLHALLKLRPGIITNNRLGGGFRGDTDTPEQHIPATGIPGRDWETCMTMNGTWGYKSYDHNWKSTRILIRNLVDIVSKGGNYLLNVGPTSRGEIPQPSIERLQQVGRWMKVNGEAIYATTASPTRRPPWGRITVKAGDGTTTLYLHVFDWPKDTHLLVSVSNETESCHLLADPKRQFKTSRAEDGLTVTLTGEAPDPICSAVVLTIKGRPEAVAYVIRQRRDGQVVLRAAEAELHGGLHVESKYGRPNIGFWIKTSDSAAWTMRIDKPGEFEITGELACTKASRFEIALARQRIKAEIAGTGDYGTFKSFALGKLKADKPGTYRLTIKPDRARWSPINLRTITLKPVR